MVSNKMKYLRNKPNLVPRVSPSVINKPWEPFFSKEVNYFTVLGVLSFETIKILITVPF
jgi:hypothetical protein